MALKNCKECGKEVSSSAAACPHCGAPQKRKPHGCGTLIAVIIGGAILAGVFRPDTEPTKPPKPAPPVTQTPEQKKADEEFRDAQTRGMIAVLAIRKAARNPDSISISTALHMEETGAVCITYRGQNGFGGMSIENAVATKSGQIYGKSDRKFTATWDAQCAGRKGHDIAYLID